MSTPNVEALLLAAGFGKRLAPLTDHTPKPLVPVCKKPLIDWNLELLSRNNIKKVFVNLHYLPDQIRQHVGAGEKWNLEVEYVFEEEILDTGGAIANIVPQLESDTLLVLNSDTLFDPEFSLCELLEAHRRCSAEPLATLALRESAETKSYGEIKVDDNNLITQFLDARAPNAAEGRPLMFAGAHVLAKKLLRRLPSPGSKFSITQETYRDSVRQGEPLLGYLYSGIWSDCGTAERLQEAENLFRQCSFA